MEEKKHDKGKGKKGKKGKGDPKLQRSWTWKKFSTAPAEEEEEEEQTGGGGTASDGSAPSSGAVDALLDYQPAELTPLQKQSTFWAKQEGQACWMVPIGAASMRFQALRDCDCEMPRLS